MDNAAIHFAFWVVVLVIFFFFFSPSFPLFSYMCNMCDKEKERERERVHTRGMRIRWDILSTRSKHFVRWQYRKWKRVRNTKRVEFCCCRRCCCWCETKKSFLFWYWLKEWCKHPFCTQIYAQIVVAQAFYSA